MFHSVGMLCPSGVLFRSDEPPHWAQSTFGLADCELGTDLAAVGGDGGDADERTRCRNR